MNLQSCFNQLKENKIFQDFQKENPSAYLCSGFFTIDKNGNDNKQHLDFFIPGKDKIFSFQLENEIKMKPLDTYNENIPEKILMDFSLDFDEVEEKINNKMKKEGIKDKIHKLIYSLQKVNDKNILTGTIFTSMFGLLQMNMDIETKEIIDFEKKSFFDMVKVFKNKN